MYQADTVNILSLESTINKMIDCFQRYCRIVLLIASFCIQDFEIELEGAQTLRILVYKIGAETDNLIGKCAMEVRWKTMEKGNLG